MQCKVAKSLGELESTHTEVWGTLPYKSRNEPTVFFGIYDLRDYISLWLHKGKSYILWAGQDLENLRKGFIFNDGKLKWLSKIFKGYFHRWIRRVLSDSMHYVEDAYEKKLLKELGYKSKIVPSFLGKVSDFPITEKALTPQVFISGHLGREAEYGFSFIEDLAKKAPKVTFHIFGSKWETALPNVRCHGRVPKEVFNKEISKMHCGLRLNRSDGFSEITAKSVLNGGHPITYLYYPHIDRATTKKELVKKLRSLKNKVNLKGRNYYLSVLNQYPWNEKRLEKVLV